MRAVRSSSVRSRKLRNTVVTAKFHGQRFEVQRIESNFPSRARFVFLLRRAQRGNQLRSSHLSGNRRVLVGRAIHLRREFRRDVRTTSERQDRQESKIFETHKALAERYR